jgi:hypothetical protein
MLTAYFDETNTASNQVVPLVAGYLASTPQWSRFNEQWTKLLVRYKVPIDPKRGVRIAHRTDIHRLEGALFEKWTEPHRDEFLGKAYVLIRRHTRIPFGNAVYRKQFEEIVPKKIQKHFGGAYGWCVYSSLFTVKDWCELHNYKKPIQYIFEAGAPGQKRVNQILNEMFKNSKSRALFRMGGYKFQGKEIKPLQAADFLAWALGRYALDVEPRVDVNVALADLLGPVQPNGGKVVFWDEKALRSIADDWTDKRLYS